MEFSIKHTVKRMMFLSALRYVFLFSLLIELTTLIGGNNFNVIYCAFQLVIGYALNLAIFPYYGFHMYHPKVLEKESDFIPLKEWMIIEGRRELSGYEYEELVKDKNISSLGKSKLETIKSQGLITISDVVNLAYFETQIGKPFDYLAKSESLKSSIKGEFK